MLEVSLMVLPKLSPYNTKTLVDHSQNNYITSHITIKLVTHNGIELVVFTFAVSNANIIT